MPDGRSPNLRAAGGPKPVQVVVWLSFVALFLFLSLRDFGSFQVGAFQDDAVYARLARAIAGGEEFLLPTAPGELSPPRHPFGFPLLLAPVAMLSDGLDSMKLVSLGATILNLILLFYGWRSLTHTSNRWVALFVCGLYATSPLTVEFSRMVMSEAPFLSWSLLTLILTERYASGKRANSWLLGLGLAVSFAVATRTIGVVLLVTVFLRLSLSAGRQGLADFAKVLVVIAGTLLTVSAAIGMSAELLVPSEYVRQATDPERFGFPVRPLGGRVLEAASDYAVNDVPTLILKVSPRGRMADLAGRLGFRPLASLIGVATTALVLLGWFQWWRERGLSAGLMFGAIYCTVLMVWPWGNTRFLYPVQPQIYAGALLGATFILRSVSKRIRCDRLVRPTLVAAFVLLLTVSVLRSLRIAPTRAHVGDLANRTAWIEEHAEPDAVLLSEYPHTDLLYSGRIGIPYPTRLSPEETLERAKRGGVDLILVAPELRWQARYSPVLSDDAAALLRFLQQNEDGNTVKLLYHSEEHGVHVFAIGGC